MRAVKFMLAAMILLSLLAGCYTPATQTQTPVEASPTSTEPLPEASATFTSGATATATGTPTAAPTETPSPTPFATLASIATPIPGWTSYRNDYLGYQFNYPANATVHVNGFGGMPSDDPLPAGFTFDEYFDYAETVLPDELCVSVENGAGSLTISPPYESAGRFVGPCPGMGIGTGYIWEKVEIKQWIAGTEYEMDGTRLTWESSGVFDSEFYRANLNNGFRVVLIGMPPDGMPEAEYAAKRQELFEILMTLGWFDTPDLTLPGFTCAGKFTRLMPSVPARVIGLAQNLYAEADVNSALLGTLEQGTIVKVLHGPACTQEQVFWQVVTSGGEVGWTAEGDFQQYFLERYRP